MPLSRMGEGLRTRPSPIRTFLSRILGATLPRLDPTKYGLADYDFYGGVVDFQMAKTNGLMQPIIRVGQGYYGVDAQFKASAANSKGLFIRDFYWMLDTKQSANGQATLCADLLRTSGYLDDDSILWADFELAPANATFLSGFLITLHGLLPNLRLGIYTGYSYWQTYGSTAPSWTQYPLWISWPVDPYREPLPLKPWPTYYYHQWTFNGDGRYYGQQSAGLDLDYMNPMLVPGAAVVIKRPLTQYQVCLTPSKTDVLPLVHITDQAAANNWEASMNCGAGFEYTDASHARVKGISAFEGVQYSWDASFPSIYIGADQSISDTRPATLFTSIPYARRAILNGTVNLNLDNAEMASWSLVGFTAADVYLIVTRGREGVYGMTQLQAARYAQALGLLNCYLMDSGHSSSIEENGVVLYSEYGEPVPQCIGLKHLGGNMTLQAQELLGKTVTVRSSPQSISGNSTAEVVLPHGIVTYLDIVDDVQHPGDANYKWLYLGPSRYANYIYPPNGLRFTLLNTPPSPMPTGTVVTLTAWEVVVNVNGVDFTFKGP